MYLSKLTTMTLDLTFRLVLGMVAIAKGAIYGYLGQWGWALAFGAVGLLLVGLGVYSTLQSLMEENRKERL